MNVGSANDRGPGPAEAHSLVARHVDDEAAGEEGPMSESIRNVSGDSVSCRTQLTMMSCRARNPASGIRPSSVVDVAAARIGVVVIELHDLRGWIGELTAVTPRG